jgi:hypothetical protein
MGIDAGVYVVVSVLLIVVTTIGFLALVLIPFVLLNPCFTRFGREDT